MLLPVVELLREGDAVDRLAAGLRAVVLRTELLRAVVLRAVVLRPVVLPVAVLRAGVLRVEVLRAVLVLAAPLPRVFAALDRVAVLADFAERAVALFARFGFFAAVERDVVERGFLAVLRALEARRVVPLLDPLSSVHFPDITRCAASATASAINEPSRVALDTTVFAAWLAESAASIPASRIFLRADGLALIAAAAAARPAASISLLIAALAILSTVVSLEPRERVDDREVDFRLLDLAIGNLPVRSQH